jgi:hypothetical protein
MDINHRVLRFVFQQPGDAEALQRDLSLAFFCAESLFGPARVRLEASHALAEDGQACVIESRGEAAEAAVRLFTAFSGARVGEEGFTVQHVEGSRP